MLDTNVFKIREYNRVSQIVTESHRVSQSVTECRRVSKRVTVKKPQKKKQKNLPQKHRICLLTQPEVVTMAKKIVTTLKGCNNGKKNYYNA